MIAARTALPLSLFLVAGASGCGPRATPEECRAACERTARFETAARRKANTMGLHELEEAVEAAEDIQKANAERVRKEMALGDPRWDEAAVRARKLSPAALQAVLERHAWELAQLKLQREAMLRHDAELLAERRRLYDESKRRADEELARATSEAGARCSSECVASRRKRTYTECLQRTQAIEDVEICRSR